MLERTRCPRPECAAVFDLDARELGRGVACPTCGVPFTARPFALWSRLLARQAHLEAGEVSRAVPASESDPKRQKRYLYHPAPTGAPEAERLGADPAYEASLDLDAPRQPPVPCIAVLDDVRSQWNVGAIFRTADAAGFEGLRLCGITPVPPARGVCKTSLGAEHMVPWRYAANVVETLTSLRDEGRTLWALELGADAESVFDVAPPPSAALVLGNEVVGVSAEALGLVSRRVALPMAGRKGSLNVAVAFGIAAFVLARAWRAAR